MPKSMIPLLVTFVGAAYLAGCSSDGAVASALDQGAGAAPAMGGAKGTGAVPSAPVTTGTGNTSGGLNLNLDAGPPKAPEGQVMAIIRDFHPTFPDMEPCSNYDGKLCADVNDLDICGQLLDAEGKPVYAGPPKGTGSTGGLDPRCKGQPCFWYWYRDTKETDPNSILANIRFDIPLQFVKEGESKWVYDNKSYFPIDNKGYGAEPLPGPNKALPPHNFSFTTEIHLTFTYEKGQEFTFVGDDDLFVFIDKKLAINMGGIHDAKASTIKLDTLGLVENQKYALDFFGAERHVFGSTFHIETTIKEFVTVIQ